MNKSQYPSLVRYLVIFAAMMTSVLLYLDRFCISIAEIYIKEDLGLSDTQIAWMLSAFFWTYALCQVPSGWLTDRFGARAMLTIYVLLWSLFTGLTGLATGFVMLVALRLGFGVAQAGAYPTCGSLISKWIPVYARGMASSFVALGGRVGGAAAIFLTTFLILMFVPVQSSSQLESGDLLNAPRFCYEMLYGLDTSKPAEELAKQSSPARRIGERIVAQFSPEARDVVLQSAGEYSLALDEVRRAAAQNKKKTDTLSAQVSEPTSDELQLLTNQLNLVIQQNIIYIKEDFLEIKLPGEAKKILRLETSQLSSAQQERLNRLLLERVYRQPIRKIYGRGWRKTMLVYGFGGIFVAGFYWFAFRNRPANHPLCNDAEVKLIESGLPKVASGSAVGSVPMRNLLTSGSMWLNCLMQLCTNIGWVFLVTWLPRYLENVHQIPLGQRAVMILFPMFAGPVGMFLGGIVTDVLVKLVGPRWGRSLPMSISRFMAMGAYVICLFEPSPWVAVAAFSLVAFSTDLGVGAVWAFMQDVGGRYVGSILGWGNMWGNLGAAITPPLLIWIVGDEQNWNAAFMTCAAAFLVAGIAALGVNATIPIAPKED